ncbi:Major facilitator superfamily domain containing protein [Amanita muscaria]
MFGGMMLGAVGWGTCSDLLGRTTAFNATLFFTALFGILASFSYSFPSLCVSLFFLGSAVGGSMPTDGTLLLEHMPKEKQYLVTALSIFFSFGAVLSAVVALLVVPQNSCPAPPLPCNVDLQNKGWKYVLITLGFITLTMFLARIVFFRLHESPRYLVHAGRPQDAVKALQMISRFNGSDLSIELCDVVDHHHPTPDACDQSTPSAVVKTTISHRSSSIPIAKGKGELTESSPLGTPPEEETADTSGSVVVVDYSAMSERVPPLDATYESPKDDEEELEGGEDATLDPRWPPLRREQSGSTYSITSSRRGAGRVSFVSTFSEPLRKKSRLRAVLPKWLANPLGAWSDRVLMLLTPEWFKTTLLVWMSWTGMSLAFTMFNVFLPKLLEHGSQLSLAKSKTLQDTLWDVVIFTIGGCPGAILGAYLVESHLGRRLSLAGSTFSTAAWCILFTMVQSVWAVRFTTVGISLSATTMWAVLYGWTPEIFSTKVRGTACGTASALSRIGGMIAPLLGGMLLVINRSIPVYTSVIIFVISGFCVLFITEDRSPQRGRRVVVH